MILGKSVDGLYSYQNTLDGLPVSKVLQTDE
jgi:hypothetical protein